MYQRRILIRTITHENIYRKKTKTGKQHHSRWNVNEDEMPGQVFKKLKIHAAGQGSTAMIDAWTNVKHKCVR